jgi:hypothetical protein
MSSVFKFNGTIISNKISVDSGTQSNFTNLGVTDLNCTGVLTSTNMSATYFTGTNVWTSNIESSTSTLNIAAQNSLHSKLGPKGLGGAERRSG